jgi:hypothetical protein
MGYDNVEEALGEIGDCSLRAEVNRYRCLERKRKALSRIHLKTRGPNVHDGCGRGT